jgi:hypothetical protein
MNNKISLLLSQYNKSIIVWRFRDAPTEYKNLSEHDGNEDWLAFIPNSSHIGQPFWMESGTPFGRRNTSEHIVDGGHVYIGAH